MPYIGQFKTIAVLLVALCTFASFFYFTVWSSIDTNNNNSIPLPSSSSSDSKSEPTESVIFRQRHPHQPYQPKQNGPNQEPQQPQEGQTKGFDETGRPFLLPETELRPMTNDPSQENNTTPSDSTTPPPQSPQSPSPSPNPPRKGKKQRERERLKLEKAERKRLQEEHRRRKAAKLMRQEEYRRREAAKLMRLRLQEERSRREAAKLMRLQLQEERRRREAAKLIRLRLQEERRRRKAAKLMRLQQLDNEPYPALISTNNARVAALNLRAFAKFCLSKIALDRVAAAATAAGQQESLFSSSAAVGSEMDFASYEDWINYIHNKNAGQEQEQTTAPTTMTTTTSAQNPNSPNSLVELEPADQQAHDTQSAAAAINPPKRQQQRPLFMERPLRGWIINHTAILEPCNRETHTSAHCLDYLTKDHLYLIPSREARSWPNRIHKHPSQVATIEEDEIEPENESMTAEKSIIDGYQRETGSGSDGRIVTTSSTITTTTITSDSQKEAEDELDEAGMMDFHIFWQGAINDKLSLSAHSFLFSQPLDRARLHLWIDSSNLPGGMAEDYLQNSFAKDLVSEPLNKYIKFHVWNQEAQHAFAYPPPPLSTEKTDFDQLSEGGVSPTSINTNSIPLTPPVALSDEARFLILNRYGGMYLDADVLLLRDMSPFYDAGMEFAYEWSNQLMYNTAILRLNKGSNVARRILDGAIMKEKEIQEKKLRKAMKGENPEAKVTKDGSTGVDPLRLEKVIQVKEEYKDSARVQGGNSMAIKQPSPVLPFAPAPGVADDVDTPASNQEGYDSGEDDALGSSDGDSLFAAPIDRASGPSSRRHHHHRRRQLVKRGEMRPNEIYHPARLRGYLRPQDSAIENNGLVMMPVAAFDPLWLRVDDAESKIGLGTDRETTVEDLRTFPDAFSSFPNSVCPQQQLVAPEGEKEKKGFTAGPEVFMMGAYAYHWHNNWLTPIEEQSWMGLMREAYEQFLAGERPNLYGEWFHDDNDSFLF